ncbi:MAG TPA: HAMP domain-containing protein [Aggregatilinea sp.]|uniref:HAMP domain-containing sensor histidine kinase n=1 Tax=Aggregatilinea sp. TaxID=2806333 RepID=UPI002C9FB64A|nr:ATP-binding protein [Aggregatilinea sp.]HML20630.1 HAMP domain-containing protein [Aggregatilinea sp.]
MLRSSAFQRFWAIFGAVSVRTKVLGIVLGIVLLLSVFVTVQVRRSMTQILHEDLRTQATSITSHVATSAENLMNAGQSADLNFLVDETKAHYSDARHNTEVAYLFVTAADGTLLGSSGSVPRDLLGANPSAGGDHHISVWRTIGDAHVLDVSEHFTLADGSTATVHVGLSDAKLQNAVSTVTRQLIVTSVIMSLAGIAAAVFLTWIITRPISNLVEATQAVARGDLSQRVTPWANDEIGRLTVSFNAMTGALAQAEEERAAREELRAQYVSRVIAAQEEERGRIARELHDSTSQSLTSLLVGLHAMEQSGGEDLRQHTEDLRQVVSDVLEEVHGLAWQLRPSVLDDLGLSAALRQTVADYRARYNLTIDLSIHGIDGQRLSSEVETTMYRIVQEALTNVARHAQAHTVSVMIDRRDTKALVIVEDDGIGMSPDLMDRRSREHLGLFGIRERAELLGGTLKIESEPGHGTSLFVEIPAFSPAQGTSDHGNQQPG